MSKGDVMSERDNTSISVAAGGACCRIRRRMQCFGFQEGGKRTSLRTRIRMCRIVFRVWIAQMRLSFFFIKTEKIGKCLCVRSFC
ncbi:hypothetical protein HW555_001322 [Spodoptera exigua]|uniref:Uncharacterized protein n=1 Tax=Spodoptera exigua TaxID=7107 RepID=A0A835LBB2_SPOEX|nr:hypothetical protein HW555_001322 [Spodoptera exigua]